LLASGGEGALLLAGLIALQNLPEGFNAWLEMPQTPDRTKLAMFSGLALLGPAAALAGHLFLADSPGVLGALMVFAAGGILYLVFEDIAPADRMEGDWRPPLGAVAGFSLGLAGHLALS
ncbi:MAG: hypothetical protein WBA51_14090, partial [Erythrobacter sp.]